MKTISKVPVKSGGQVVDTVEYPEFESLNEAVKYFADQGADGTATVLGLVNTQHATNVKNKARSAFNTEPSEATRNEQAMAEFGQMSVDEMKSIAAQPGGVPAWMKKRSDELLAQFKATKDQRAAAAAANVQAEENSGGEEQ